MIRRALLMLLLVSLGGCLAFVADEAGEALVISFELKAPQGVVPSYQTAIWVERLDNGAVTSLFVSQYLALSAGKHADVCTEWTKQADWDTVSPDEFDAVTSATPAVGEHRLRMSCRSRGLAPGVYRYYAQTHIVEDYNILYSGQIEIGKGARVDTATVRYCPRKHPRAADVLSHVTAAYEEGA